MKNLSQNELKPLALESLAKFTVAKAAVEYFEEPFKYIVIDYFLPGNLAE